MRTALLSIIAAAASLLSACSDPVADPGSSPTPTEESSEPAASRTTDGPAAAGVERWST